MWPVGIGERNRGTVLRVKIYLLLLNCFIHRFKVWTRHDTLRLQSRVAFYVAAVLGMTPASTPISGQGIKYSLAGLDFLGGTTMCAE